MRKLHVVLGVVVGAVLPTLAVAGLVTTPLSSKDGLVTVAAPQNEGWSCAEQSVTHPVPTTLLKCRRVVAGEFFFAMAKQYQVPADQIKTAKELATDVYPADYAKFFRRYDITGTSEATLQGLTGVETRLDAVHEVKGEVRKVERVFVQGRNVFLLSAEGYKVQFDGWKGFIDAWMTGARFKAVVEPKK